MFQFDFNWSDPINLCILALAIALLPLQLWLILSGNEDSRFSSRRGIRLSLNVMLWLAVIAFIMQPYWLEKGKSVTGFFVGKDVPLARANALTDSISRAKKLISTDFKTEGFDTLILAGADFHPEIFQSIMRAQTLPRHIQWIPYFAENEVQSLRWNGILRKGELQTVRGEVNSSKKQVLKLTYENKTLDSALLDPGFNQFRLQFPIFAAGRVAVELAIDDDVKDTIRFFARLSEKLTFQFILDSPDFESRALATWLGKAGHAVIYAATLSKDISSKQTINAARDPDVIITDASNAGNKVVVKSISSGKSVLFINLTDAEAEIKAINTALRTQLQVSRVTTKESVPINRGLTALPFQFVQRNQYPISRVLPVAAQKIRGKVGVSLLNETFPLQLSGDSAAYQKVWDAVLAAVLPVPANNVEVEAPLFKGIDTEVGLDGFSIMPRFIKMGQDTIFAANSPLNEKAAKARFKPTESGWISSEDSLNIEMYVEEPARTRELYKTASMIDFIRSYHLLQDRSRKLSIVSGQKTKGIRKTLPDWMWFSVLLMCFAAVWVERKL